MVLTPHAVVGAALASALRLNPVLAFIVGFASHFLIDPIPHWDYQLASYQEDDRQPLNNDMIIGREFYLDLMKIGFDCLLGFVLAGVFFLGYGTISPWSIFFGAVGAVFPDFLHFVYLKYRKEPLRSLQRFHVYCWAKTKIINPVWGVFFYSLVLLIALLFGNWSFFI